MMEKILDSISKIINPPQQQKQFILNPDSLADLLPWGYFAEGTEFPIMINKDGRFQTTFSFRGYDLDSSTINELTRAADILNNALKRLGSDWSFHVDAIRKKSRDYSTKEGIKNIPVYLLEVEREEFFKSGFHYESEYYITFSWLTPTDKLKKAGNLFFERGNEIEIINTTEENLKYYKNEIINIDGLLSSVFKEFRVLTEEETLNYYHSLVSDTEFTVKVPEAKIFLDNYITDCVMVTGTEPKLGTKHLRMIAVLGFPGESTPGILDSLNKTNIEYRWNTRFLCLDKLTGQKLIDDRTGKWFSARMNLKQMIMETFTGKETRFVNKNALSKTAELERERQLLDEGSVALGYYTTVIIVTDESQSQVEKKAMEIKKRLNNLNFTAEIETFLSFDAWLGTMPGNTVCNVRKPPMNTIVLSHLLPTSAIWAGDNWNKHLNEPPLVYTQTTGNTPFRLNLHYNDVAHSLMVGPTGAGKSVHLAFIQGQYLKYKNARVIAFDKGGSTRVLNKAAGGIFYDLGSKGLKFQPLAKCDDEIERLWCQEWLEEILTLNEGIKLKPLEKTYISEALKSVGKLPVQLRTMSSFVNTIRGMDQDLKIALEKYTGNGILGQYFDGYIDFMSNTTSYMVFEMEKISQSKMAVTPALSYLFHKIETELLDGRPTLITLDECWLFFDNPQFEAKIREWLKVLRKKNAGVLFATQSLTDIANSSILSAVLDACYSRIYLANPNAETEEHIATYKTFGLNETEIYMLTRMTEKKHYYFKSPKGSRLYELALSPLELAYVATAGEDDQKKYRELESLDTKEFNIEWLNYKGLDGKMFVDGAIQMMKGEEQI